MKAKFITCDPAASGCLASTIKTFGRKAFRRPLTDAEVTRFMALGQLGRRQGRPPRSPRRRCRLPGRRLRSSCSPRRATTPARSGASCSSSSYEVATRLSYMLWGSMPDDDAEHGGRRRTSCRPRTRSWRRRKRMIALRDKTAPLVSAFHATGCRWTTPAPALVERRSRHHQVPALLGGRQGDLPGGDGQLLRRGRVHERHVTRTSS